MTCTSATPPPNTHPGLTVHHKGYVNGTAALDYIAATAPGATDVVVVGESAGSIASPLYAGLVSDRLPDARITVLADGSGSYPDVPRINEIIAAWGFGTTSHRGSPAPARPPSSGAFRGCSSTADSTTPRSSSPATTTPTTRHQQRLFQLAGIPATDLLSRIDANETQIEAAGVNLLSYIAPGNAHTALSDGTFYTEEVNGVPLVDWVTKLVEGEPVEDVHCTDCTTD